jgi:hypothetical protein
MRVSVMSSSITRAVIWLHCFQSIIMINCLEVMRERLNEHCKKKLRFNSIRQFNEFVDELKDVETEIFDVDSKSLHLLKCLNEKDAIYDLHNLIDNYNKERPCKYSEIAKLENYAKKHFLKSPNSITINFFTLFGVTIGINCRINLMAHLKQADSEVDQVDFIYSMASPTGWNPLINEFTKKSMKFGTSQHENGNVINRIAKLVPGSTQIDHLDYLNFDHAMDDKGSSQHSSRESGTYELKNVQLRSKVIESLYKIISSCRNLDKFYVNSVLAMSKLKSLGLMVDFLTDLHDRSALLHKWLVATSFCQIMARVEMVTKNVDGLAIPQIEFELIHSDKLLKHRRELYSYAAPFEEIHEKAKKLSWQAIVNEGSWRQKNAAMWAHRGKEQIASSVAMQLLKQYIRGLEHDFQQDLADAL